MKKFIMIAIILISCVAIYSFLYSRAICEIEDKLNDFINKTDDAFVIAKPEIKPEKYLLEYISYNDLARKYKRFITKDDFSTVNNDEKCFNIYNIISDISHEPTSHSFYSTHGRDLATKIEFLNVDDKIYKIIHELDLRLNNRPCNCQ